MFRAVGGSKAYEYRLCVACGVGVERGRRFVCGVVVVVVQSLHDK